MISDRGKGAMPPLQSSFRTLNHSSSNETGTNAEAIAMSFGSNSTSDVQNTIFKIVFYFENTK